MKNIMILEFKILIDRRNMKERITDHKNTNLWQLHLDVVKGKSNGKIIWQPRIGCWYDDRIFRDEDFPEPYTGKSLPDIYRELGCSNRNYSFNSCFQRVHDQRVKFKIEMISETEMKRSMITPVGSVFTIEASNNSNPGRYPNKWWISSEEDMKVMTWIEEHMTWRWDEEAYQDNVEEWGDLGAPTIYMPRINVQEIFVTTMGVEEGVYALYDYPKTVEKYFQAMSENQMVEIELINKSPIDIINFGDNVHAGILPPDLFIKYAMPEYQKRNDLLHKAGKFTCSHWDGDVKALLPYAKECGFDGIEAVTPKPQGDVTLTEVKAAFGDELFLLDGIAALLFNEDYPLDELEKQTRECIELFAPKLVLGISDEISSNGNLDRIKFVGKIVDKYNAGR